MLTECLNKASLWVNMALGQGEKMLRDLEAVYAVYKERSFSKAAQKLFVSQPALSATIKKIEQKIQLPIFDRSRNPIQLTEVGEFYIRSIEQIMQIQADMEAHFAGLRKDKNGTLNLGSATFFCAHVLPTLIQNFQRQYPGYMVNIFEGNAQDLTQCLQSNIIDLSLDVDTVDNSLYVSQVWTQEHLVLAVPAFYTINNKLRPYLLTFEDLRTGNYLADDCPRVDIKHFKEENFLLLKQGNDLHKRAFRLCKNAGFTPKVFMYFDQLLTSYYVAKDGKGIAFIRATLAKHVEPTAKLYFYKIDDENSIRNIMINYRKNSKLSPVATDFIKFLTDNKP